MSDDITDPSDEPGSLPAREGSKPRKLVDGDISREIIGAFYDVYNTLGCGYLESVYSKAMEIALRKRGLLVEREVPFDVIFDGQVVGRHRVDMLVERRVVVENKATHSIAEAYRRQLLSYVTGLNRNLGMLLHFGPRAHYYRVLGKRGPNGKTSDQSNPGDP